jgi:NAD(P)-dependent dehydrogenase (short-subunit alcohol dehydrogenase family)
MCQLALPHLAETRGTIVNVSSTTALRCAGEFVFYGSVKAALDLYTRFRAKTFGEAGVRMNGIKFVFFWRFQTANGKNKNDKKIKT